MLIISLILACGSTASKTGSNAGDSASTESNSDAPAIDPGGPSMDTAEPGVDTAEPDISGWSGGNFNFQTTAAKDHCLGGAFEALFMPEGPNTPHDFEYDIYIPDFSDLPETYTIDLRDPFVEMPVSVDSPDDRTYEIRGSVMTAVELGRAPYWDCVVTMTVDVDIVPVSNDTAEGSAVIEISNPRGDDGLCPVFELSPCAVELELSANRA